MDLQHEEKEPIEWRSLHVGAERGVNCEHMQVLVTNILQRDWEWQEDRRPDLQPGNYTYNTALKASLDVKTAVDVAKPSVVSRILTLTGVHGHLTAALLAEMQDDRESARLENSETEFQVFSVHPPRWRGSSGAVGTCGQIRAVESRRKVESKGLETTLWRTARQ